MDDSKDSQPAPLEITIRFDPTAAKRAASAIGQRTQEAGNAISTWCSEHHRGITIAISVAFAGAIVWLIGGAVRALAVVAAGALVYGFMRLKARYSPLIPD